MDFKQLIGRTLEDGVHLLTQEGFLVALRNVDGKLTYPVYVDAAGTSFHGLGRTVPKVRLDVESGIIIGVEILPAANAPGNSQNSH
jgi:hypothetical protein